MLPLLLDLYRYQRWANLRILDVLEGCTPEEFHRDLGSSFPSLGATLHHLAASDRVWLNRWTGSETPLPTPEACSTPSGLRGEWMRIMEEREAFLEGLNEGSVSAPLDYQNLAGVPFSAPLVELLLHCSNHATHHRGQCVTLLRQLGHRPPTTDLVAYQREARRGGESGR